MRLVIPVLLFLAFLLAPGFLLPRLHPGDAQGRLFTDAAQAIATQIPKVPGLETVAIAEIEGDVTGLLRHALTQDLLRTPRVRVIEPPEPAQAHEERPAQLSIPADAVLTATITRNETINGQVSLALTANLRQPGTGEVIWSTNWHGGGRIMGPDRDLFTATLVIALAIAAGVLVLTARRECAEPQTGAV
jgi:hypothetical protein